MYVHCFMSLFVIYVLLTRATHSVPRYNNKTFSPQVSSSSTKEAPIPRVFGQPASHTETQSHPQHRDSKKDRQSDEIPRESDLLFPFHSCETMRRQSSILGTGIQLDTKPNSPSVPHRCSIANSLCNSNPAQIHRYNFQIEAHPKHPIPKQNKVRNKSTLPLLQIR